MEQASVDIGSELEYDGADNTLRSYDHAPFEGQANSAI